MKGECYLCRLERRGRVDADLAAGMSNRKAAAKYGASSSTVHRHRSHDPRQAAVNAGLIVAVAESIDDSIMGDTILERVRWTNREALAVLEIAKGLGNHGAVLSAIDRVTKLLVLEAAALDREGPTDRFMVMTWEDPEPKPCPSCGFMP